MQPDLMILKAPKREMKHGFLLYGKIHGKKAVFSSRLGAFKIIKSGWN
jgi:hypothetical protein